MRDANQKSQRLLGFTVVTALGVAAVTIAAASLWSCNHAPVHDVRRTFTLKVDQNSGTSDPIKMDFLWVIDNSSSMCEEQVALAESFSSFRERLGSLFQIDPRIAVTSHDAQCSPNGQTVFSSQGRFNTVPQKKFPPPCQEQRHQRCLSNADCAEMDCKVLCGDPESTTDPAAPTFEEYNTCCGALTGTLGEWDCRTVQIDSCIENPNGSINTQCRRLCTTDQECKDLFGNERYVCDKPADNVQNWGCILPPPTADCPDTVPPVLDSTDLDLFSCSASVHINQDKCLEYEQGMMSALMALDLDGSGRNRDQAAAFLRDDAFLVVIFVTDEDDCSVVPGADVSDDHWETCALTLKTTDEGGPLIPVGHIANQLKSLKSDPGKVIVAAIAGDALGSDPADIAQQRTEYIASKTHQRTCYRQSYICKSGIGKADYGQRYLELTKAFGIQGTFANICDAGYDEETGDTKSGIDIAMDKITDTIITVLNKMCLPRALAPEGESGLIVTRTNADGSTTTLVESDNGDAGTYYVSNNDEDCAVDGQIMPALFFGDPPSPGEEINVTYEADPQLF